MAEDCPQTHVLPSHTGLYLEPSYWNDRFAREEHYEWFKDYSHFRHLILSHVKSTDRVLEVGCGNSQMSEEIYKDGIRQITRTDLSPVAIKLMQERCVAQGFTGIEHIVADMLDLPFDNESFDIVIEKGTLDCLFVDSGDPWNPKQHVAGRVKKMLEETHRVLTPTGMFISIAFGQPHFRRPFFEAEGLTWSLKWDTFGDSFHYFFYTLRKVICRMLDLCGGVQQLHQSRPRIVFASSRISTFSQKCPGCLKFASHGTKPSHEGPNVSTNLEKSTFDLEHQFMDNEDYLLQSMIGDDE